MGYICENCKSHSEVDFTICPSCFHNKKIVSSSGVSTTLVDDSIHTNIESEASINKKESTFSKLGEIVSQTKDKVSTESAEFIKKNYKTAALFGPLGISIKESAEIITEDPNIKKYVDSVSKKFSETYEETGVKKHVDIIKTKSGEKLDMVSGQAMYELVQERLTLQDRYNDLLANKLHEALNRIAELEKKLSENNSIKDKI